MSFEAMTWANEAAPVADVNEFAVLNVLGSFADSDGCNAYPSRATIAGRAQIDIKTVQRTLDKLEGRKLIALGDQSAAEGIRADRRPPVYDVLIPYSWLSRLEHFQRLKKARASKGRSPLTAQSRPDIAPPPAKEKRSDAGKSRPRRVDSQSPRELVNEGTVSPNGGTTSPARVDSQSATGGLEDHQTYPLNLTDNSLSPSASAVAPKPAAPNDEREISTAPDNDQAQQVAEAWTAARGGRRNPSAEKAIRVSAAELLLADWPLADLIALAQDMAAKYPTGRDLSRHADHWQPPNTTTAKPDNGTGLPAPCQSCENAHPAARFNVRLRTTPAGTPCPACHPDAVSLAA